MALGRIISLSILVFCLAGVVVAAEETFLADAAESRQTTLVRTLLHDGVDVNAPQVDGMTALHWAAYHDDTEIAGLLVRSGADVNAANRYGVTPLFLASTNANVELVTLLLASGADVSAVLRGGETSLMTAARTGSPDAVVALLASGADPNVKESREQTALMWAAAEGHTSIVESLVEAGADVHAKLRSGFTPMFFSVREGHIGVSRALLKAGVDVNEVLHRLQAEPDPKVNNASFRPVDEGMSPLLMAVRNGHFELAVMLVKAGADMDDQRTGFTPLHTISWVRKPDASDRGDPPPVGSGNLTSLEFARELVSLGFDVNTRLVEGKRPPHTASKLEMEGATAFLMAADRADAAMMRLLLELGADPFLTNVENSTPLMAAAGLGTTAPEEESGTESEALESVQMLLELGADVNAVDDNGDTVMHGAALGSFPKVLQFLADNGAAADVWKQQNRQGRTPLFIAEGYRGGNFQPNRPTIDAVALIMLAEGLSTDGPRPELLDPYGKPAVPLEKPKKP